jgi:hypothetical protein
VTGAGHIGELHRGETRKELLGLGLAHQIAHRAPHRMGGSCRCEITVRTSSAKLSRR